MIQSVRIDGVSDVLVNGVDAHQVYAHGGEQRCLLCHPILVAGRPGSDAPELDRRTVFKDHIGAAPLGGPVAASRGLKARMEDGL